nr:regulatory protein RecX [Nakamurella aerolata]
MAPRPRATLARKLAQREVSEQVSTAVLDRFELLGLIDDRAYAEAYVRAKHRDRGLGRRGLRAELRRQGVADGDFAYAVNELDDGAERERAAELVGKRIDAAMAAGPVAARRRLLGQLARRGYPPELAVRVVNEAIESHRQT